MQKPQQLKSHKGEINIDYVINELYSIDNVKSLKARQPQKRLKRWDNDFLFVWFDKMPLFLVAFFGFFLDSVTKHSDHSSDALAVGPGKHTISNLKIFQHLFRSMI